MRQTLGTAVFAGMLGVTLFGIFLTLVFYYVVRGVFGGEADAPEQNASTVDASVAKREPAITGT